MKCVWKKLMIVVMLFSFITVFVGCGKEERKSDEKGDISVSGVVSDDNEKNQVEEQNDQGSGGVKLAKDTDKELPECEGIYYGKKDNTNSMWKVIFRNNEWYLSGYPEHKIDVIKWTELYQAD